MMIRRSRPMPMSPSNISLRTAQMFQTPCRLPLLFRWAKGLIGSRRRNCTATLLLKRRGLEKLFRKRVWRLVIFIKGLMNALIRRWQKIIRCNTIGERSSRKAKRRRKITSHIPASSRRGMLWIRNIPPQQALRGKRVAKTAHGLFRAGIPAG